MRVLYGVQATGNGHIARARIMLPALRRLGIETDFIFSGAGFSALFDMECFGDARFLDGLTFVSEEGRMRYWATLFHNRPWRFIRDVRALNVRDYDLILSDFEPISAWAARWQHVPSLGLSNQYALRYPIQNLRVPAYMKVFLDVFAPVDTHVALHWHAFHPEILPPLTENFSAASGKNQDFILVYCPVEDQAQLCRWLQRFAPQRFRVYTRIDAPCECNNVQQLPLSRPAFIRDLAVCNGVLCNSGFGVCTEALQAGKKIMTRPLKGQFEQKANAMILAQYQRACILDRCDEALMHDWLASPNFAPLHYPDVASALAQWILDGRPQSVAELARSLWAQMA